jgi:putative copper resistance protein D
MTGPMWMPTAPPTAARLLAVHLQPVPVLPAIALLLLVAYLAGVLVLVRRGDRWPIARTIWWTAGCLSILAMTATGIDGYGMELFSVHMAQHMVLGMLTPVLLVMGAPMTLVLRALSGGHRRQAVRRVLLRALGGTT